MWCLATPSGNKAWKVIPFTSKRTYESRSCLCACLSAMWHISLFYILTSSTLHTFTVTILSRNTNILMNFPQSSCLVSLVSLLYVLVSVSICLCVRIKESDVVVFVYRGWVVGGGGPKLCWCERRGSLRGGFSDTVAWLLVLSWPWLSLSLMLC